MELVNRWIHACVTLDILEKIVNFLFAMEFLLMILKVALELVNVFLRIIANVLVNCGQVSNVKCQCAFLSMVLTLEYALMEEVDVLGLINVNVKPIILGRNVSLQLVKEFKVMTSLYVMDTDLVNPSTIAHVLKVMDLPIHVNTLFVLEFLLTMLPSATLHKFVWHLTDVFQKIPFATASSIMIQLFALHTVLALTIIIANAKVDILEMNVNCGNVITLI